MVTSTASRGGVIRRMVHRGQRLIADGSTVDGLTRVSIEKKEEEVDSWNRITRK